MTDNRTTIAGNYPGVGQKVKCILNEGVPTVTDGVFMPDGSTLRVASFAAAPYGLQEGQIVAISNDVANTAIATELMPVVERAQTGETLVFGIIRSTPKWSMMPASSAVATPWATQLAGKYYRTALVEVLVPGVILCATIMQDGVEALVPGVPTNGIFNIASAYADGARGLYLDMTTGGAGGVGFIPLHYVAAGSDGDLADAAVLITGMMKAITGTAGSVV